jgi:hypothetical protein
MLSDNDVPLEERDDDEVIPATTSESSGSASSPNTCTSGSEASHNDSGLSPESFTKTSDNRTECMSSSTLDASVHANEATHSNLDLGSESFTNTSENCIECMPSSTLDTSVHAPDCPTSATTLLTNLRDDPPKSLVVDGALLDGFNHPLQSQNPFSNSLFIDMVCQAGSEESSWVNSPPPKVLGSDTLPSDVVMSGADSVSVSENQEYAGGESAPESDEESMLLFCGRLGQVCSK